MLKPNKLKKGDTIGLIAPSKPFNPDRKFELDNFIEYMKIQGIEVKLSKNFYVSDKYGACAGTPQERADDINSMFEDKKIKAIWCLQGGEPANQTLDLIDFDVIKNNPKLFLGKSDIDVLLLALNKKTELITIHTCDSKVGGKNKELDFDYTRKWFNERLFKKSKIIEPTEEWICINEGQAEGKILGCNLSSILKLAGTQYFPDFTGSIFFIETYKSYPSILMAQLEQLKQLEVFEKVKGIVIGNNFEFEKGFEVEEIVNKFLKEYNFPILKINEFGHYQPHAFLPIGVKIKLDATNKSIEIIEEYLN